VQKKRAYYTVSWGTFVGTELAKRVPGLAAAYLAQSRDGNYRPQRAAEFSGGLWLTLTDNPLDMISDVWHAHPVAVGNANVASCEISICRCSIPTPNRAQYGARWGRAGPAPAVASSRA
jgi:hypothetical protein